MASLSAAIWAVASIAILLNLFKDCTVRQLTPDLRIALFQSWPWPTRVSELIPDLLVVFQGWPLTYLLCFRVDPWPTYCISELIHTEKAHVRNLKVMHKVFLAPMKQESWIQFDLVKLLFPNLEEIIQVHST